jgi:uncharacterized small protein (DUF1192 family)
MAPGITNDPAGVFDTPKTSIPEIDNRVAKLQAEDVARKAAARAEADQERPTPNRHVGGDVYVESV